MRWSSLIKGQGDQTAVTVMEFEPKHFDLGTPGQALDYLAHKEKGSDFVMNDVIRKMTGVEQIEKQSEEQKIEHRVLEKVTEVEEQAYKEGFELGKEEGFKSASDKRLSELDRGLQELNQAMQSIQNLKPDLIEQNERHIVEMVYKIAEKIAFDHIQQHPEVIISVMKKSIETAQAEEDVIVHVSSEQIDFIEKMKQMTGRDFEFLKTVKLQPSDKVMPGGCIVETNYGVIDSQVEERTKKLWDEISQMLPKAKQNLAG
jgi:flagellar assembly protein FliH